MATQEAITTTAALYFDLKVDDFLLALLKGSNDIEKGSHNKATSVAQDVILKRMYALGLLKRDNFGDILRVSGIKLASSSERRYWSNITAPSHLCRYISSDSLALKYS